MGKYDDKKSYISQFSDYEITKFEITKVILKEFLYSLIIY